MGGIFSSPAPPPMPQPDPQPDPEEEARKERIKMIERRRRGRAGLVATSDAGLDGPADDETRRLLAPVAAKAKPALKTKLGE